MGGVARAVGLQPKAPVLPEIKVPEQQPAPAPTPAQQQAQQDAEALTRRQTEQLDSQERDRAAADRARRARLSGRSLLMMDEIGIPPGTPITQTRLGG